MIRYDIVNNSKKYIFKLSKFKKILIWRLLKKVACVILIKDFLQGHPRGLKIIACRDYTMDKIGLPGVVRVFSRMGPYTSTILG